MTDRLGTTCSRRPRSTRDATDGTPSATRLRAHVGPIAPCSLVAIPERLFAHAVVRWMGGADPESLLRDIALFLGATAAQAATAEGRKRFIQRRFPLPHYPHVDFDRLFAALRSETFLTHPRAKSVVHLEMSCWAPTNNPYRDNKLTRQFREKRHDY